MAVDLYPDTSELDKASRCELPAATINSKPAYVFSSFPRETTEKHFEWMATYGIDGALVQRFINHIPEQRAEGDRVLKNVRTAAEKHGRAFAVEYDLSGANHDIAFQELQSDWEYITDELNLPSSTAYLRLNGKPAACLYGLLYRGTIYFYQSSFDEAYQQASVGLIAMGLAIQSAIREGAEEYDLLHGDETYKSHWSRHSRDLARLESFPPGGLGELCRLSVDLVRASRQLARRAKAWV